MREIFEIPLEDDLYALGRILCRDKTQLNSDVLRVYKNRFDKQDMKHALENLEDLEIDFDVHVISKLGRKLKLWSEIGRSRSEIIPTTMFRQSDDYGNPNIKLSNSWSVWRVNEPMNYVGALNEETSRAEIGVVWNPKSVINRIKTDERDFFTLCKIESTNQRRN